MLSHFYACGRIMATTAFQEMRRGCRTIKLGGSFDAWIFPASGLEVLHGVDGFECFPCFIKVLTKDQAAQVQDVFGTGLTPKHTGLLEPVTDDSFAACFDDPRPYEGSLLAEANFPTCSQV